MMATESPMRLIKGGGGEGKGEGGGGSGWSVRSGGNLRFTLLQDGDGDGDGSEEELGSLLNASKFKIVKCSSTSRHGVPNRSGSAPPTVEGSFSAMVGQGQWRGAGALGVEDQLPHNYFSRLPAQGERSRVIGSNKLRSLDDSNSRSLFSSGPPLLPTHNEEPESQDRFPIANLNLLVRQTSSSFSSEWLERERERASDYFAGMSSTALGGRPKSLVDLIQQDFPRTPSPVYNLSRSSSRAANDEGIEATNLEAQLMYFGESAISATKTSELSGTHSDSCSATGTPSGMHMIRVGSTTINLPAAPVARIPSPDSPLASAQSVSHGEALVGELTGLTEGSIAGNSELNSTIVSSVSTSDTSNLVHVMQSFSIVDMEDNAEKKQDQVQQKEKQAQHFNLPQQQYQWQQRVHVPSVHGRVQSQALTQAFHQQHQHHTAIEQALQNQSKFSTPSMTQGPTMGLQPTFQSGGASAPHLYATAAAYMASGNTYFQNLQSALYAPQYGISGYPMNTSLLTPVMTGYPHGSMPMVFDNAAAAVAASMNLRAAATAAHVGGLGVGVDMQQLYKFNGQLGTTLQPALTGPTYLHYLQRSAEDAYNNAVVVGDPLAVRGFVSGSQMDILEMQKASMIGYGTEHKSQFNRSGTLGVPIASKSGSVSPAYYGTPSVGLVMQYPSSPLANPVLPGSAGRATSLLARPIEQNFRPPLGSNRLATMGAFTGWQSQRGNEKADDLKCSSFLEELKNNKTHRFELSDIAGHIVEFSADQQGSRFIQQKLETSSAEEKALVFQEVLPQASVLMTDVFGNYVIQKFFEHGTDQQRMELANQLFGHVLALSLQMYGCRVVQKALEVVNVNLQTQLVSELDGSVMRCVRDQNGNHVIQKCIECVPTDRLQFIISSFYGQVVTLSTHPYGCRVIQRVLEHCTYEQKNQGIMEEILEAVCNLSQDQYGNYVAQHVLEHGKPLERSIVINKLAGQVVQMSQHKFASNVVEKCLEYGDPIERQMLIDEMLGTDENDNFQIMMKDQYGNYVVQKVLETCNDQQREKLLSRIRVHLHALKKYTYGKHIVARVEKLLAVGEKRSSQV